MHIGIDIRCLDGRERTGVGEYASELIHAITKNEAHSYVLFRNAFSQNIPHEWNGKTLTYTETRWPNKLFNLTSTILHQPQIDHLLKKPIDIFFSPNLNFTRLSPNTKHILTIHDLSFEFFPEYFTAKQRLWHQLLDPKKQCKAASHILTPSENTKRDIVNYFHIPEEKVSVIYPGLTKQSRETTVESVRTKYFLSSNYILFLGTREPRKNIETLLQAFAYVVQRLPFPTTLVIAGASGWQQNDLQKKINLLGVKNQVQLIGYVPPEDKTALLKGASIFVYPSFYEGFGFPVLEAMYVGTPVITSNRSSLGEVAENTAYLAQPHSATEIARGIEELLTNQALRNDKIQKAQSRALRFSWERAAEEWHNIVQRVISQSTNV